jgi:hypothetical protein
MTEALDAALARAFPTPATPADLRAGVRAAIARERTLEWQARRDALEREHRAAMARLNQRYLRGCRDALLLGACLFAVLGLSIKPLAVWLTPIMAAAAPLVAGLIALSVGVLCGAAILQDLFRAKATRL